MAFTKLEKKSVLYMATLNPARRYIESISEIKSLESLEDLQTKI